MFHGDILQWKSYWEQFSVSIYDCSKLMKDEKLVYLQNSVKDKTTKGLIEGLTRSSEHHDEAVKCLLSRYDRPRVIHQAHVRRIIDAPPLKALGHEPSKPWPLSLHFWR